MPASTHETITNIDTEANMIDLNKIESSYKMIELKAKKSIRKNIILTGKFENDDI